MATKLILIRHGATDFNLRKKYSGLIDTPINNKGRRQATCLGKRLKQESIHKIYASDRKRAVETARIAFKGLKIEKIPALQEINFGCFEGLTHKELLRQHPLVYKKWLNDPFSVSIPDGESLGAFKKRIVKVMRKIVLSNPDKTIAVVSHGGAISIFINELLKSKDFWKQIPASASISIIEYKNRRAKIKLLNDTTHLH